MSQFGSSRTQKLIYRSAYKKHRQRLQDIRQNNISNQHILPPKPKPNNQNQCESSNKPKRYDNTQPLQSQNNTAQAFQTIKGRSTSTNQPLTTHTNFKRSQNRYNLQQRLQFTSDCKDQDGQQVKCIMPSSMKNKSFSIKNNYPAARVSRRNMNHYLSFSSKYSASTKMRRKSQTNDPSSVKQSQQVNNTKININNNEIAFELDSLFNYPQRNPARKIFHKRTLILGNNQSCLIQISQLGSKYFIIGCFMGSQYNTIRYHLSQKQTKDLINNNISCENYDDFCRKIKFQKMNQDHQGNQKKKYIKIKIKQHNQTASSINIANRQDSSNNRAQFMNKKKHMIQNEFLKRNFYTFVEADHSKDKQKDDLGKKNTSVDKQDSLEKKEMNKKNREIVLKAIGRLAQPKQTYHKQDEINNESKTHNNNNSKDKYQLNNKAKPISKNNKRSNDKDKSMDKHRSIQKHQQKQINKIQNKQKGNIKIQPLTHSDQAKSHKQNSHKDKLNNSTTSLKDKLSSSIKNVQQISNNSSIIKKSIVEPKAKLNTIQRADQEKQYIKIELNNQEQYQQEYQQEEFEKSKSKVYNYDGQEQEYQQIYDNQDQEQYNEGKGDKEQQDYEEQYQQQYQQDHQYQQQFESPSPALQSNKSKKEKNNKSALSEKKSKNKSQLTNNNNKVKEERNKGQEEEEYEDLFQEVQKEEYLQMQFNNKKQAKSKKTDRKRDVDEKEKGIKRKRRSRKQIKKIDQEQQFPQDHQQQSVLEKALNKLNSKVQQSIK